MLTRQRKKYGKASPKNASDVAMFQHIESGSATIHKRISKISGALASFVNSYHNTHYAMGIFQVTNLPNLLNNFDNKLVYEYIDKLFEFITYYFNKDVFLELDGLNNIVFAAKISGEEELKKAIEEFYSAVKSFCYTNEFPLYFILNCGTVIFERDDNLDIVFKNALISLYESQDKNTGYNLNIYDPYSPVFLKYKNNIQLAAYFQKAYKDNRLKVAYQPVVRAQTGEIKSYECLLRVMTESGDFISAGPFVKVAEKFGFIDLIDSFMLDSIVSDLKENKQVHLGMNISNLTVTDRAWLIRAKKLLTPPIAARLTIEITETGSFKDLDSLARFTSELQALGAKVAIDDFGSGNTSFSQLKQISIDVIKLDGQFIRDLDMRPEHRLFVETMLTFSSKFGIQTVAEFVENGAIAKILISLGIDYLQGNFISQALNYKPWAKKVAATA